MIIGYREMYLRNFKKWLPWLYLAFYFNKNIGMQCVILHQLC